MDKPSIQMDDLEERDVRRTAAGLIRMLFGILLFILAVYVVSTSIFIFRDSASEGIVLDIPFFILAIVSGIMIVTTSISLYKRRKWLWQKKGEVVKVYIHETRSFVKSKKFRPVMQLLLTVFATLALSIGVAWGFASHEVHYFQTIPKAQPFDITAVTSDNNEEDIYFQPTKDARIYYVIHDKDFTTPFTSKTLFNSHIILSMICKQDRDDLFLVDVTLEDSSTLRGVGCTVVEIRLQQPDPQKVLEFMTAEYATNHSDYYQNNWPLGAGIIGASVLFIVAVWLLPSFWRRRTNLQ